jgi:hypothetical protein
VVERLLGLLARNVNDASWLLIFFACVLGVFVGLFVIVTLATIFDSKRLPGTRLKVFKILTGFFRFRKAMK